MHLKIAFAGALRALRLHRKLRHEDLSDASVKSKLSALERGETSITLEKFETLAHALKIEPVALLAICMSKRSGSAYPAIMEASLQQLQTLESEGALLLYDQQFCEDGVTDRKPGKPQNKGNEGLVRELKDAGMNQYQIAKKTGLSLSTIHRYWKRINDANNLGGDDPG